MSAPIVLATILVLLVRPTQSTDPSTVAMAHAIEEGGDPGSVVVIRESQGNTFSDDALARASEADNADSAAAITLHEERRIVLRVYVAASRTITSRDVAFEGGESPLEKARTAGFVIASVLRGARAPTDRSASPPPHQIDRRPPPSIPRPWRFAAEAQATSYAGLGGPAGALGGEVATALRVAERLYLRAGAGFGFGTLDGGAFATTTLRLRAGTGWEFHQGPVISFGARIDLLAIRHAAELGTEAKDHWVGAAAPTIESTVRVSPTVSLVANAGPEIAFGTVRVVVGDEARTRIPWARLGAGVGARLEF